MYRGEGKLFDDIDGRVVGPSKSSREFGASRGFDILLEAPDYLSKHPDFGFSIPTGYQYIDRIP